MNNRLISTIKVKAADSESWTFTGTASTPTPDRMNDTVDPFGAVYSLPLPLLWAHDHKAPVGHITKATVTRDGIKVEASITQPDDGMPIGMANRLREAWHSVKTQLARGLSIGFIPQEYAPNDSGGMAISKWDWNETSIVVVPAQQDATIATIKALSAPELNTQPHDGFSLRHSFKRLHNTTGI